ncbi:pimeloyl-ACP methyl ester carboxylesterase [Variovorax sp. 1133]
MNFMRLACMALILAASTCLAQSTVIPDQPAAGTTDEELVRLLPGFENQTAEVNGVRLHYVIGGKGPLVILLPGWPQNWWEYHKVMPTLAANYRVASVDFRGMGTSSKPADGYDKKTMAHDIAELIRHIGSEKAYVVGHDIGAQVAFAVAANHPDVTRKLVLIDVAHPDAGLMSWPLLPAVGQIQDKVGDGSHAYLWWFAFHQVKDLPERLMADGRARIEQDWFFRYLTADESSIDPLSRDVYARSYWNADAIRAGNAWYQAFPQDIIDEGKYAKVNMPVMGIAAPGYEWVKLRLAAKATTFEMVKVQNSGHFIPEEQPQVLIDNLRRFLR